MKEKKRRPTTIFLFGKIMFRDYFLTHFLTHPLIFFPPLPSPPQYPTFSPPSLPPSLSLLPHNTPACRWAAEHEAALLLSGSRLPYAAYRLRYIQLLQGGKVGERERERKEEEEEEEEEKEKEE